MSYHWGVGAAPSGSITDVTGPGWTAEGAFDGVLVIILGGEWKLNVDRFMARMMQRRWDRSNLLHTHE